MFSTWRALRLFIAVAVSAGCAAFAPKPKSADPIRVEKDAPPSGARALGELSAVDGKGCGLFGTLGSYDGAVAKLRARANALGADYVQITQVKEPQPNHECVEKEYAITGLAYRVAPAAEAK
jgi:hypothetical protein